MAAAAAAAASSYPYFLSPTAAAAAAAAGAGGTGVPSGPPGAPAHLSPTDYSNTSLNPASAALISPPHPSFFSALHLNPHAVSSALLKGLGRSLPFLPPDLMPHPGDVYAAALRAGVGMGLGMGVGPPEAQDAEVKDDPKAELEAMDLWKRFYSIATEMVITKSGRSVKELCPLMFLSL